LELEIDNIFPLFSSEAIKTLQDLSIETRIESPVTDLPMFSAPELVRFEYQKFSGIPDEILRSLAMNSPKLKEVRLRVPDRNGNQAVYFPLRGLEKVFIEGASNEFIEILCRQNRDLQSLEVGYDRDQQSIELYHRRGLSTVSMTHLAALEHLTNIKVCHNPSDRICTPTSLLSFLRNRASRPNNLELLFSYIDSKDPRQMVNLKQEIERQKLEDGSEISVKYTDRYGHDQDVSEVSHEFGTNSRRRGHGDFLDLSDLDLDPLLKDYF